MRAADMDCRRRDPAQFSRRGWMSLQGGMMKRDIRGALAAFAFAFLFSGFAGAQVQGGIEASRLWKLCPNEVFELPQEIFEEWVPVGCEAVDCCPGCPGVLEELQWRIRVEGTPLESVG